MEGLSGRISAGADVSIRQLRLDASAEPAPSGRLRLPDVADEAEPLAGDRPDQALLLAAVADRLAHRIDVAGQGRFGDDPPAPHRIQQVVLADDALAVLHQIEQQVEDLRPDRDRLASRASAPAGPDRAHNLRTRIARRRSMLPGGRLASSRSDCQSGHASDSTAILAGTGAFASALMPLVLAAAWTNIQANSKSNSRPPQGLPAGSQAPSAHRRDRRGRSAERREQAMKIVVIGGSGLIGTKLVTGFARRAMRSWRRRPPRASTPSPARGWPRRWPARRSSSTWRTRRRSRTRRSWSSSRRPAATCWPPKRPPACGHHVALSVVGTDRMPDSGYLRAKMAQENLIKASGIPYTILRATQFFEFVGGIAKSSTDGQTVRLSPALMQPIVSGRRRRRPGRCRARQRR